MKKIFVSILSALVLIGIFSAGALAAVPDPGKDFYYLDQVGVMSTETKSLLYTNGEALEKACGAQIVVCVVDSFGKMSAEDFAYELINKWGVGDKTKKNGVALVIAEGDGEYRMDIGTGLERYMDGSDVQEFLDRYFDPYFKKYETDKGIQALYAPLFKKITSIYDANVSLITGSALPGEMIVYDEPNESFFDLDLVVSLVVMLIIISIVANAKRRSRVYGGGHRPVIIFSRPHFGGHHHHGGHRPFGGHRPSGGSFGGSRSGGRPGGFGGARGGGGGSRGVGGGGRR